MKKKAREQASKRERRIQDKNERAWPVEPLIPSSSFGYKKPPKK